MSCTQIEESGVEGVAIVGMAGRFPGALDVASFWKNVLEGVQSIRFFSDEELHPTVSRELRASPDYVRARGYLDNVEMFDRRFFGYSPLEASVMDPQQRVFCEVVWAALEDAGCIPGEFPGPIGVFAGAGPNTYFFHHVSPRADVMRRIGDFAALLLNEKDFLSTRVSYKLNLRGASFSVGTGCSTSLTAVFEAYQYLMTQQCDVAVAGGVEITTPQNIGYLWHEGSITSRDGICRPFDVRSGGMVSSNGAAVVVLKRLSDAIADNDRIYAVIRGAGINNDGSAKIGFTSPSVEGQAAAIAAAQAQADVDPSSIGFVEAHGTGTELGDPIEVQALCQAFGKLPRESIFLGSVKGNIGHLGIAAGVAGLIKAALHHRVVPPMAGFTAPNPRLGLEESPFHVNVTAVPFPRKGAPRRAAVSALGLGGTNVHVVLEEAPVVGPSENGAERPHQLLVLSARNSSALVRAHVQLLEHLERERERCDLSRVALTLSRGRTAFSSRNAIVCSDIQQAIGALRADAETLLRRSPPEAERWPVTFVFPGQGVQYAGMARELYELEPTFRDVVDDCAGKLSLHLKKDIRELLLADESARASADQVLNQTANTQPALFVYCYALAQLWMSWGVVPESLMGHSVGEYVGACLSGVFSLEDALYLVSERGRLVQSMGPGSMLSVALSASELEPLLPPGVCIAAYNAPSMVVASGPTELLQTLRGELVAKGAAARFLVTSHAYHSESMSEAAEAFESVVASVARHAPRIAVLSTATGTWLEEREATDPRYWAEHVRRPVLFAQGLEKLWEGGARRLLLEIGPRATTTSLAQRQITERGRQLAIASIGQTEESPYRALLQAAGRLWTAGVSLNFERIAPRESRQFVQLPTYPFERKEYWIEATRCDFQGADTSAEDGVDWAAPPSVRDRRLSTIPPVEEKVPEEEQFLIDAWHEILGVRHVRVEDDFFEMGGHSLAGVQLLARLKSRYSIELELKVLLQHSTVRQMAELIRGLTEERESRAILGGAVSEVWSPMAMLAPGMGGGPPLYCVAGIGGTVMELHELATNLEAHIPFFGLESRGVAGHEPHETIAEMAAENVRAVKAHQPDGPYFIAGYSIGGTVAFEMAQQLRKVGDTVALLAFIDAGSPTLRRRTQLEMRAVQLKRLMRSPKESFEEIMDRRRARASSMAAAELKPFERVAAATVRAFRRYAPKPYDGEVVLFRTHKDDYVGDKTWVVDEYEGWRDILTGKLEVIAVPGRHLTVCQEPANAVVLGKALSKSYNAALARIR